MPETKMGITCDTVFNGSKNPYFSIKTNVFMRALSKSVLMNDEVLKVRYFLIHPVSEWNNRKGCTVQYIPYKKIYR